jgi:hypothetical protein
VLAAVLSAVLAVLDVDAVGGDRHRDDACCVSLLTGMVCQRETDARVRAEWEAEVRVLKTQMEAMRMTYEEKEAKLKTVHSKEVSLP